MAAPADADGIHLSKIATQREREYFYKIRIADLDIKPFAKLHKYFVQDQDIMNAFVQSGSGKTCRE